MALIIIERRGYYEGAMSTQRHAKCGREPNEKRTTRSAGEARRENSCHVCLASSGGDDTSMRECLDETRRAADECMSRASETREEARRRVSSTLLTV